MSLIDVALHRILEEAPPRHAFEAVRGVRVVHEVTQDLFGHLRLGLSSAIH